MSSPIEKIISLKFFANPGSMRVSVKEAVDNNISDPRNGVMLRMLSFIRYGERAGSGLQGIFRTWKAVYHTEPRVEISASGVDRTTLFLEFNGHQPDIESMLTLYGQSLNKPKDSTQEIKDSTQEIKDSTQEIKDSTQETKDSTQETKDSTQEIKDSIIKNTSTNKEKVIFLLRENSKMTLSEVADKLGLTRNGVKKITDKLRRDGLLSRKGPTKSGEWVVNS